MDKGLNLREIEGLFDTAGEYVDIVKLGWGTSYVTNNLEKKIALYRSFATPVVCGGTLFEAVYGQGKMDEFKRWLEHFRFSHVEISDGTLEIPREQKLELIAEFARDFVVLSEVGSKDSDVNIAPYLWVQWIREELDAGAWKVIAEGREGGTAGIYRPTGELRTGLVDEIEHSISFHDLIWEAPTKSFAGLVRAALRARGQPREHPAGRGHRARDAPARPACGHAEGGAAWRFKRSSPPRLPDLDFEAMTAEELIAWAHQFFWPRVCLTCSWQKQSSVLVHMVAELGLRMDTVELDTHLFFRESYDTRDALVDRYQLKLIQPSIPTIAEQHRAEGPNLWERDPDRCCHIRKVEPLVEALQPYDAWISGIRRDQSPSRVDTPKVQWSERYQVFKIHPLADWDEKRVWAYINVNEIPSNPLHDAGYRSIGCIPCTRPTSPDEEERAGRWAGSDKLECGIHENTQLERTA